MSDFVWAICAYTHPNTPCTIFMQICRLSEHKMFTKYALDICTSNINQRVSRTKCVHVKYDHMTRVARVALWAGGIPAKRGGEWSRDDDDGDIVVE